MMDRRQTPGLYRRKDSLPAKRTEVRVQSADKQEASAIEPPPARPSRRRIWPVITVIYWIIIFGAAAFGYWLIFSTLF